MTLRIHLLCRIFLTDPLNSNMSIKCVRSKVEQLFKVRVQKNSIKSIRIALKEKGIPTIYDIKAILAHASQNDIPNLALYLNLPSGPHTITSIQNHVQQLFLLAKPTSDLHTQDVQQKCITHAHRTRFDIAYKSTKTTPCSPATIPQAMGAVQAPLKPVPFVYGQGNTIFVVGYGISTSTKFPKICNKKSEIRFLLVCDLVLEVSKDRFTGKWYREILQDKGDAKRARGAAQVPTSADLQTIPLGTHLTIDTKKMVIESPWNIDHLQHYTSGQLQNLPLMTKIQQTANRAVTSQTEIDDTFPPFITCTTGDRVAAPIPLLFKVTTDITLRTLHEFQFAQPVDARNIKFMTKQGRLTVCRVPNKQEDYS